MKSEDKLVLEDRYIEDTNTIKQWFSKHVSGRTFIVIKKTFRDVYSLKKIIISLVIMLIIPIIFILLPTRVDFGLISPYHASSIIAMALVFPFFFWSLGLIVIVLIGASGAPLIAEEVKTGTMLILVSKPISRIKIFLGKYLALYSFGVLISALAIFITGWLSVLIKSGNIDHFISMIPYLAALFLYSLFVLFLFTSITMALSSLFKKSRSVTVVVVVIAIVTFLAFQLIRVIIGPFYAVFQLYHIDLGYHLGNVYVLFLEGLNAIPPSASWQQLFGMLTGVYNTTPTVDPDQGLNLGGLEKTNYYLPIFSLIIWLGIAILLLIFGLISLKKREISI